MTPGEHYIAAEKLLEDWQHAEGSVEDNESARQALAAAQVHAAAKLAAAVVAPRTGTKRHAVLAQLALAPGGLTDEELNDRLGMNPNTFRPRRVELAEYRFIEASGAVRQNRSGSDALVWTVTDKGRRALEASK